MCIGVYIDITALSLFLSTKTGTPENYFTLTMVGGNLTLTIGGIAGGACFGDSIGLISDCTVVSSGIHKVEVTDRIRHQGAWALICLVLAGGLFFVAGRGLPAEVASASAAIDQISPEVFTYLSEERPASVSLLRQVEEGVPLYMVIPLILVLAAAIKGFNTILCLGIGIISSLLFGYFAGTVTSITAFSELLVSGFADAGSWVIVMMMWIGAFGGIMSRMRAFDPLANLVLNSVKSVRQLLFSNGILSILGNAALADEMAQIVTMGPISKNMTDEYVETSKENMYKLRLRNATFNSSLGVFGSQLIPWHVYILFYVGIASAVYPLHDFVAMDIIRYNFLAMISVVSLLVLTITGFDRFIPGFALAKDHEMKLKKTSDEWEASDSRRTNETITAMK